MLVFHPGLFQGMAISAFQEGVGVEVVCTTSLLPQCCKASHKCTPDWTVGELEATTPSGNACAGRGAICGLVCSLPQYIADSNLMCIYLLGKLIFLLWEVKTEFIF